MTQDTIAGVLRLLDRARRAAGVPSERGDIVRERSPDGSECRIVFSDCPSEELDDRIRQDCRRAVSDGYTLEWKVYGHDRPADLANRLTTAGFDPGPVENVLSIAVREGVTAPFDPPACEIRRVDDHAALGDVTDIARAVGRADAQQESRRLAAMLRDTPDEVSIFVAYLAGEPVASGRVHFPHGSELAELAGGRTKPAHRRQGLFTALVAARVSEARVRGRTHVVVDALPSSDSILRRLGFRFITTTQPFMFDPHAVRRDIDR